MNSIIVGAPELEWLKEDVELYNRTMRSLELFDEIMNDEYETFTAGQPDSTKLNRASFSDTRHIMKITLQYLEEQDAMKVFIMLNNLTKVKSFAEKIESRPEHKSTDHNRSLIEVFNAFSEISPTFTMLNYSSRKLIAMAAHIGFRFNMDRFIKGEDIPMNLENLFSYPKAAFDFYRIHAMLDYAATNCDPNAKGSTSFDQPYWIRFNWADAAAYMVCVGSSTPRNAYMDYIGKTMSFYSVATTVGARLCTFVRVANSKEANDVEMALAKLPDKVKSNLINEFLASGIGDDSAIILRGAYDAFQNAIGFYKKVNPDNCIFWAVMMVAPILSKIYEKIRGASRIKHGTITAFIEDVAKAANNPEQLKPKFVIERVGKDFKVSIAN